MKNSMRSFSVLLVIPLLLIFGNISCHYNAAASDADKSVKVIEASNSFGLRLYKRLALEQSSFVICPISLSSVLGMTFFGSKGVTAAELNLTLGYEESSLGETDLLDAFKSTMDVLNTPHADYQLKMANSMWVSNSIQLNKHYERTVTEAFESEIHATNFADSNVTKRINEWASKQTNGKIPQLFSDSLDPSTALLLLNAVYFKGTWHTRFNPKDTYLGKFFYDGNSKWTNVPMMTVRSSFRYYSSNDLDAEVIELPYAGYDISMIVILPRDGITLSNYEERLKSQDLYAFISSMTEHKVLLILPKFKLEKTLDLKSSLRDMGVRSLFGRSDLSGISNAAGLTVSEILQKTQIEVNEEGSEAAAASSMIFSKKKSSGERVMVVNRPFMFIIGHIPSGSVLFFGRVNDL